MIQRLMLMMTISLAVMVLWLTPIEAGLYEKGGALGSGAQAMGMAGAITALVDDETALFWNPAGLSDIVENKLGATVASVYDGQLRCFDLAGALLWPKQVVTGFGWRHKFYPQTSEINSDEMMMAASIPLDQQQQLHLGLGLKLLFGHTVQSERNYSGIGMDVGLRYHLRLNDSYQLQWGLHAQDLDTRITWQDQQSEQLPIRLALGSGLLFKNHSKLGLDLEYIHSGQNELEETSMLRLGAEHWFRKLFAFRAGYILDNHQVSSFSLGVGLEYGEFKIDYALSGQVAHLGYSHRFSLSYGWPRFESKVRPPISDEKMFVPKLAPEVYRFELAALPSAFSPNGDGLADTVILQLDMLEGLAQDVARWELIIYNEKNIELRRFNGQGYPEQLEWDGADKTAKICDDGFYYLVMTVYDQADNELGREKVQVQIKTDFLPIDMELSNHYLIKMNGQLEQPLKIVYAGARDNEKKQWEVLVQNQSGRIIKSYRGSGAMFNTLLFDGKANGKMIAGGRYQVIMVVTDTAGLRKEVSDFFQVNAIKPSLTLSVTPRVIKPAQKNNGEAVFSTKINYNQNIRKWQLQITDKINQQLVKTITGHDQVPAKIIWKGTDNQGEFIRGGRYLEAQLKLTYQNGIELISGMQTLATDLSVSTTSRALALHLTAINFESGSADIPLEAYKQLDKAVNAIKQYAKNYRVQIKGHTDQLEAPSKQEALSWERVLNVKDYLNVTGKIPIMTIDGMGYGDRLPMAPKTSPAGRAKNRRVEIVLIIEDKNK